jgi:hypothetical protein
VLSSGAMKVRTPAPTESFLALRIPKTQEQVWTQPRALDSTCQPSLLCKVRL